MRRLDFYSVRVGDDLGDPDFWNRKFEDVDLRLHGQEEIEKDWRSAVRELQESGLKRIDEAVTPLLEQLEEDLQLGAVFIAESSSAIQVQTGHLNIGIDSANRRRYSPAAYLALVTRDAPYAVMLGRLIAYNRETGTLSVDVERTYGAGEAIRTNWIVSATSHVDYQSDKVHRSAGGGLASTTVEAALREILQLTTPRTRSITAGTGLAGGGDLSDDRTLRLDTAYTDVRYVLSQEFDTHRHLWSEIDNKPTTLSGYGIGNAYTQIEVDTLLSGRQAKLNYVPEDLAKKGQANGYAPLGPDGKIAGDYLPLDGSFKGTYNAATNVPAIASGSGTQGDFWIVSVGGTVAADNVGVVSAGDQIRRGPEVWQRVPTFNAVTSVAGKTGTITLDSEDLSDGGDFGRQAFAAETADDAKALLALKASDISDFSTRWTSDFEGVTSAYGRSLASTASSADARTLLGLGSAAMQASSSFAPSAHVGAGGTAAHPDASTSTSGFMSAADKTKLNGVAANANNYVHPTGDGNLHVPATATGSLGKVLKAGSTAGSMTWSFVAWSEITGKATTLQGYGITDAYSSGTVDTLLSSKQDNLGYTAENISNKGSVNGYASLDGSGKIPASQLPALAIVDTAVVATQAAMLALTAQKGDVAIRTDVNKSFILRAEPATTLSNWEELRTPTDVVQSVAGRQGAVTLTSADLTDSAAFGRSMVGAASQAAARTLLALTPGTNVQAQSAGLQQIANLSDPNADRLMFWDDSAGTYAFLAPSTGLTISGSALSVRMATSAQTIAGTDTDLATNPAGVRAAIESIAVGKDDPRIVSGYRNRHLNPAFQVNQDRVPSSDPVDITSSGYIMDGVLVASLGSGVLRGTQAPKPTPGGSPSRARLVVQTADTSFAASDYYGIEFLIEGIDVADLQFGTSNAKSFVWRGVVCLPQGTYGLSFSNNANRSYVTKFSISAAEANKDKLVSVVVPGDTSGTWLKDASGIGLRVRITFGFGSSFLTATEGAWLTGNFVGTAAQTNAVATVGNTLEVADVGLYAGTQLPEWLMPNYDDDLRECRRYFRVVAANVYSTGHGSYGGAIANFDLSEMRGTPLFQYFSKGNFGGFPSGVQAGYDGDNSQKRLSLFPASQAPADSGAILIGIANSRL